MKKRKCSGQCICVVLIFLIGLLVIAQMIYIAYQVNRTKIFLDDSIKEMNEEIYPKEISMYLQHLIGQFEQLDQYTTQSNFVLQFEFLLNSKSFQKISDRNEEYFCFSF
jgi:flagellar basal body-associated protein FliL